jgi:hypothetical protein
MIFVLYEQLPDSDIIKSGQVCFALYNGGAIGSQIRRPNSQTAKFAGLTIIGK